MVTVYTAYVLCAETVNTFKNRLDKHWSDQEVLFDYNAVLHGIGNRRFINKIHLHNTCYLKSISRI